MELERIKNFRLFVLSGILGGIFSACIIFGENIFSQDTTAINNFSTWIKIFLFTPIFSAIIFAVFKLTDKINFSVPENINL